MEELIHYMQRYYNETLKTQDERVGFVMYMAEAFKRYATVKTRMDKQLERGYEKLRRMTKEETDNE